MQYVVIGTLVALGALALLLLRTRGDRTPMGFRDFVRDPDAFDDMVRVSEAEHEAKRTEAAGLSDRELTRRLEDAILRGEFDDHGRELRWTYGAIPERVVPAVVGILRDPAHQQALMKGNGASGALAVSPVERATWLLEGADGAEVVRALEPFARAEDGPARRAALKGIATTRNPAMLTAVVAALDGKDAQARRGVLEGLTRNDDRDLEHWDRLDRAALFDALLPELESGERGWTWSPPVLRALERVDGPRTRELLLENGGLDPERKHLSTAVHILSRTPPGPSVAPKARAVVDHLRDQASPGFDANGSLLKVAAQWLGSARLEEDRALFADMMSSTFPGVRAAGAAGALAARGRAPVIDVLIELISRESGLAGDEAGPARPMTLVEREIWAAAGLQGEVENGGFDQYFFNSSADDMDDALAGLERVGATEMFAVASEARARFGPEGPPRDRAARQRRLSALSPADTDTSLFDDLDGRLDDTDEDVRMLADLYCVAHPEEFGPPV